MGLSDKSLMDAHIDGSSVAFGEVVRLYGPGLLGYLTKVCSENGQAEDFFQETFRKVHEKAGTFRGGKLKSWIFTIATRIVIDNARRKKKLKFISLNQNTGADGDGSEPGEVFAVSDEPSPCEHAEKRELVEQVRGALGKLSPRQRTTLVLSYYQDMSYRQVAEVMDCSVGTVKTQMFRALKRLSKSLPEMSGGVL